MVRGYAELTNASKNDFSIPRESLNDIVWDTTRHRRDLQITDFELTGTNLNYTITVMVWLHVLQDKV